MTINLDKQLYLVICSDKGEHYVAERELCEMDSRNTLQSVASGEWTNLASIIVFNPVEHICTDVTREFVTGAMNIWADSGEALTDWQRDFIEQHVSIQAANSFARAA